MGKETGNRAIDFFNILNSNSSLTCTGNNSPISPIIFYSFNCFLLEVTPVDPVIVQIINRKAGWPTKILLNQDVPMLPIHPSRLDFRFFAPVGPVHKPVTEDFLIVAFHLVRFLPWNKAWTSDKEMGCFFLEAWVLLNDAIFILYFRRKGEPVHLQSLLPENCNSSIQTAQSCPRIHIQTLQNMCVITKVVPSSKRYLLNAYCVRGTILCLRCVREQNKDSYPHGPYILTLSKYIIFHPITT